MSNDNRLQQHDDRSSVDTALSSFIYDQNSRNRLSKNFSIIIALLVILLIWSFITTIDQTVDIKGQIVPQSGIANLKHESGGEVIKIHVNNYDTVKEGDLLLTIDNQTILTSLKQNKSKLKVVDSEIVYAVAFIKNNIKDIGNKKAIKEVEEYLNNISDTISHSKQLAEATKLVSEHKDQVIVQQIKKNNINIAMLEDEILILKDQLDYLNQQRSIFQELLKSKNVSKIRAIDYEIRYREILRELSSAEAELNLKAKDTKELESRRIVQKTDSIKEKYEELVTLNKEKIDLVSNIDQLENSLGNLNITAPISGVLQGLDIVNGVTIQPGEEVLSIIPTDSDVLFEAEASLEQKGKINIDSTTEVQFDGFNILQFDRIDGKVINISPYTFDSETKSGDEFFKVIVKLSAKEIYSKDKTYNIKPGMSGTLYVSTGEQSLFAYLFGPIYNAFAHVYDQK